MTDTITKRYNYETTGLRESSTKGFGYNTTLITSTTAVEVLAAPGAGYHWEIRRIRMVNQTTSETPIIIVQDDAGSPVELYREAPGSQADGQPAADTGWLPMPIVAASNVAIDGKATSAVGDTTVYVWAEKVAD